MKRFRLRARDISLTYPKCTATKEEVLLHLSKLMPRYTYICVTAELHQDGTPHLHCQLQLLKDSDIVNERQFDYGSFHCNIQKTIGSESWNKYIKKDGSFTELGSFVDIYKSSKKRTKQELNKLINDTSMVDLVDQGIISMFNYTQIENAKIKYNLAKVQVPNILEERKCYWIYGEPGIGKTYWVRSRYPTIYVKPQNKWWDGYASEDSVLIDDFDCSQLGHLIKIWADKYSFNAEIKGSTIKPLYSKLFLTSNYLPYEIWKDDSMLSTAVSRRFILCTIYEKELVNYYDNNIKILI